MEWTLKTAAAAALLSGATPVAAASVGWADLTLKLERETLSEVRREICTEPDPYMDCVTRTYHDVENGRDTWEPDYFDFRTDFAPYGHSVYSYEMRLEWEPAGSATNLRFRCSADHPLLCPFAQEERPIPGPVIGGVLPLGSPPRSLLADLREGALLTFWCDDCVGYEIECDAPPWDCFYILRSDSYKGVRSEFRVENIEGEETPLPIPLAGSGLLLASGLLGTWLFRRRAAA